MTSGTGRSPTSSTTTCSRRSRRPADPRRPGGKRLTHEDLSGRIIEDELGPLIRGLRRAPGAVPERDAFATASTSIPRGSPTSSPSRRSSTTSMPRWLRWLQPLLSGVFTVDNLDYVRRDAYLTGVATGPVDVERLRRYTFISSRGLTLYEPGLGRPRDLPDGAPVHVPAGLLPSDGPRHRPRPGGRLRAVGPGARRRRGRPSTTCAPTPTSTSTRSSTRPRAGRAASPSRRDPRPGDGTVTPAIADAWRAILLRQPTWRAEARDPRRVRGRAAGRTTSSRRSVRPEPGRVAIDLAEVDARPADAASTDGLLALEARDGSSRRRSRPRSPRSRPTG